MTAPRWVRPWMLWLGLFLALELPAAMDATRGGTLSEFAWLAFPTWWWWLAPAGLLISLAWHFSPRHGTVRPVAAFGAIVGSRMVWATWGWWPFVAAAGAALAWWLLWPGEHLCVSGDVDQPCRHRTRLGALIDRSFREPNR